MIFEPSSQVVNDEAALTFITPPSTAFGMYTLTLTAKAESIERVATIKLTIFTQEMLRTIGLFLIIAGVVASVVVILALLEIICC